MSKVAHYLQEHLVGEVMTSTDARRYFATDASILQAAPALVAYPRNENDIRKTCRFTWQLAERGRVIPVTARGSGTDQTGAAIGNGVMVVFPAHLNRVLELDTKTNTVTVEPGINFGKLQQTLHTHGRFLPAYPASLEYSTVGGAIANNASGEKSGKYGDMSAYVQALRVVLANGEVIETGRISKREIGKKLGLATFEGEIYRSLDALFEEQQELINALPRATTRNKAGYNLADVRQKDGSFDLTPLFVGSQGTLGVISEALLTTEAYLPETTLQLATFDSLEFVQQAVTELLDLPDMPSAIELIDGNLIAQVTNANPNQLKDIIQAPFPAAILLVEFDGAHAKKMVKKAAKTFEKYATSLQTANDAEQQQQFWKLRQSTGAAIAHNDKTSRAVPLIGDGAVPVARLREFVESVYGLLQAAGIEPAVWGHAGDGLLHVQPRFDLAQVGDRQKAFKLMDEYNKLVISFGGTISAENGDGRLHTPYLEAQYGVEQYALLQKVKNIFDPYGTLNPGVKFGTSLEDLRSLLRSDYGLDHFYDHLPRN